MRVLGIVPARKGSKRVPDKNFRRFAEKPLFTYMTDAALDAKMIHDIVVNSDHGEILNYCSHNYEGVIALERPSSLAADHSPAIEYVRHTLKFLKEQCDKEYDVVVILQPSSPLTLSSDIDNTISLLHSTGADTAVSVVKLNHMIHPLKMKIMVGDKLLPFLEEEAGRMAAHELPDIYVRNCAVYATRRHCIEQGIIIGSDCRGFLMPPERSVDINEMLDFHFAEFLFSQVNRSG